MKWLTFEIQRTPGFRFNLIDLLLLLAVGVLTWVLAQQLPEHHLVWVPPYVAFTFFLFCNVFRIGNRLEPFWYIPFGVCVLLLYNRADLFWVTILAVCEPLKLLLIAVPILRGNYRGAFCKRSA